MNCREIGRLVSEKRDRQLPFGKRMHLRMHLLLCSLCRKFSTHIDYLGRLSKAAGDSDRKSVLASGGLLEETLSPEAKSRIKSSLRDA